MYYDIEEEFREKEPDIDEQINELKKRKILAEKEFEASQKTKEDSEKYNYTLLVIAENKNELLEKKLLKMEAENCRKESELCFYENYCRYSGAERFFLWLLCGFATTVFLSAPDNIIDSIFQLIGSFFLSFIVMLTNVLFPKDNGSFCAGKFYENHPNLYSIIVFLIIVVVVSVIKAVK